MSRRAAFRRAASRAVREGGVRVGAERAGAGRWRGAPLVCAAVLVGLLGLAWAPGAAVASTSPLHAASVSTARAASTSSSAAASAHGSSVRASFVPVPESPGSTATIQIDTDLYTPRSTPAPAVLLAMGFGQTKVSLAPEAKKLQAAGYVVLAYTARGFGHSGGSIGLDSLNGEVPDARALITTLARNPNVERRHGDPVIGVVGGSYGGALALMVGATDPRVDTVVAAITWNNLADALDPVSAGTTAEGTTADGIRSTGDTGGAALRDFKSGWASRLFGAGISTADPCGRFTPQFCALYAHLITGGQPSAADLALLDNSSPSKVLSGSHAPTLLLQGLQDSLFDLQQADANERALKRAGAPVQVRWFNGGHDGGGIAGTSGVILAWLADHLKRSSPVASTFTYAVPPSATAFGQNITAADYPGLQGAGSSSRITLLGAPSVIVNPAGGQPDSLTGIPGLGTSSIAGRTITGLLGAANPALERATFTSAALTRPTILAGTPTVSLRVTPVAASAAASTSGSSGAAVSSGASGSSGASVSSSSTTALLYAQLSVVSGDAVRALPGGVSPIRVTIPAGGATIAVSLPSTTWSLAQGDRVMLNVRTSDFQFVGSTVGAAYRVAVTGPLAVPTVPAQSTDRSAGAPAIGVLIGIAATLLVTLALLVTVIMRGRRRGAAGSVDALAQPAAPASVDAAPLRITGLTKRFRSGFVAVDDVSFSVEQGQVLGLLGENGAGKTTTLRMVAGLIQPDAGTVEAFGAPVGPGSPVLSRLGCFIEGPGFLPHLTGRRNLELYWAATGRDRREAHIDKALTVADLGAAIDKRVRGYSQGMRQRLAIAQAMLGLPDLLVLDEPTNGLDPPQIAALRGVLRHYAEGGRTVVVSSHLLAEVEQTCTHVVVMSHGRVVAAGPVAQIAEDDNELLITVTDVAAALTAVRALGITDAERHEPDGIRVRPGEHTVDAVVAALVSAGVGVTGVQRGRHLEEAFLALIGATEPSA